MHWAQAGATLQEELERGPRKTPAAAPAAQERCAHSIVSRWSTMQRNSAFSGVKFKEKLKKWSFYELRKYLAKKVSPEVIGALRKYRPMYKLQTFL